MEVGSASEVVPYDRDRLIEVLIYHQRLDITHCACGWGPRQLGKSHAAHVADVYEDKVPS